MLRTILTTSLAATLPVAALAAPNDDWLGRYDHMMWGGYGFFGGFMMLLFWGLVIAAIFVVVKWLSDNLTGSHRGKRDAMDILRERFAAGEIEEEEFERRKKALER